MPFCWPAARSAPRESLRPPPGRSARAARTLNFQNEERISLRRCAANPGRAGPRPQAASFRGGCWTTARGPSRSPTGPTSDCMRVPLACNRAPSPPLSRGRAAGAAGSASPQALSTWLQIRSGTAVPARGCPRGRREKPAVMLVDADGSPAWRGPAAFLAPGAAEGRRRAAALEGAARAAVGFKARAAERRFQDRRLASLVDVVVEERTPRLGCFSVNKPKKRSTWPRGRGAVDAPARALGEPAASVLRVA